MSKTFTAIALVLALASTSAVAAPRNPECAPLGKIFRATVQARQKGSPKGEVEKLAAMIEDPGLKSKAINIVNRVYGDATFETAAPATAAAFFSATCR